MKNLIGIKVIIGYCIVFFICATTNSNTAKLSAQENEKNAQFEGTWLGDFGVEYSVTITGNEVVVMLDKSYFDEWVNFFEEKRLNVAKGIIKVNGNSIELILTHIWGNFWAYFDEDMFGNFDYWQTPKEYFERYGEEYIGYNFEDFMNVYSKSLFTASGVVSGNRMRLRWNDEVQIITKQ